MFLYLSSSNCITQQHPFNSFSRLHIFSLFQYFQINIKEHSSIKFSKFVIKRILILDDNFLKLNSKRDIYLFLSYLILKPKKKNRSFPFPRKWEGEIKISLNIKHFFKHPRRKMGEREFAYGLLGYPPPPSIDNLTPTTRFFLSRHSRHVGSVAISNAQPQSWRKIPLLVEQQSIPPCRVQQA